MNKISGIYKIINKINGKFYIGSSIDIKSRFYNHKSQLNKNIHDNQHLQNAWNKYKKDNFDFIIIKLCESSNLIVEEQKELDIWVNKDECYNLSPSADVPMRGIPRSDEVKQKISLNQKGKPKWTEKQKKQMSIDRKGRKHSTETIKKFKNRKSSFENIKKAQSKNIGRIYSEKHCKNISTIKKSKNKKFSQEEIEKIRIGVIKAIKEGRYNKNKVPFSEYENIKSLYLSGNMNQRNLAFKYGITPPSMNRLLKRIGIK